jgi:hypothetical protein
VLNKRDVLFIGTHLVLSTSTHSKFEEVYQVRKAMRKGSKLVDPEVQVRDVLESFQMPATTA